MAITQLKEIDELVSQFGDINAFTQFAIANNLPIYSLEEGRLLMPENQLSFQILREFLDWEFTQKVTALNQLYQKSSDELRYSHQSKSVEVAQSIYLRKPPKFKPCSSYRETAFQAILLQGEKRNQLCEEIRNQTELANNYIEKIAKSYPHPSDALKPLTEAFRAIAIEAKSESFDWDKA